MFTTLESNWDQSARRGWTTLASFTMQALGLSLLLAIPLIWVQRPPQLHWLERLASPAALTPRAATQAAHAHSTATAVSTLPKQPFIAPRSIPLHAAAINDADSVPPAPDFPTIGTGSGRGPGDGVAHGLGDSIPVIIPQHPAAIKPLVVSHWAEGNIIYRVQPSYPPIARLARVQGAVELRAIISKTGAIENLIVVSGHPMLVKSAIEAVRQWRYRPYLLNNEPIEVETEITVNFVLSGG
jgi:periplasmic protein TonB